MKILFLYTRYDSTLQEKTKMLEAHNAEVSTLSLLEYKLYENGESHYLEPYSPLEFLEKSVPKIRFFNRILKRKKLLNMLGDYDIIDLYKCDKSSLFIVDEIREKCYDFFITIADKKEHANLFTKPFYKYLYKKARFLLFSRTKTLHNFTYGHSEKSRLVYNGIPMLNEIDKISEEELFKASFAMGFDLDKDIIYCDMSGDIMRQQAFIDALLQLPQERLRQSTFIFHLNQHNFDERQILKKELDNKNFDFILIEALVTPKQSALLYKIADKSIILTESSDNPTLALSLYTKHHVFLYHDTTIDEIYKKEDFFIEDFERFQTTQDDNNPIIYELRKKNRDLIYRYFNQEESINNYIEVLKEV